jgi:hypothetical protein
MMRVTFKCDPALIDLLPRPRPAREMVPDWLRSMPASAFSEIHGEEVRTVKQCPPFIDAMSHGFMLLLPCDVRIAAGVLSWDWDLPRLAAAEHPRSPISFHVPAQVTGTPFHDESTVIVKFHSFWTVELEPGWSLFATHPVNRHDLPFQLLSGLVDADRFNDIGILFPAVWTDPGFAGVLARGTPIAQCFPVPRSALSLDVTAFTSEEVARYATTGASVLGEPGVYRKRFRARRVSASDE